MWIYIYAMKTYKTSFKKFYELAIPVYECNREAYKKPILSLIERYNLFEKKILSIGSGSAQEEFWFHELGRNSITLSDIDESGKIEPMLSSVVETEGELTYLIGDANQIQGNQDYDVIYISSFTPDENRRSELVGKEMNRLSPYGWPKNENPFMDMIPKLAINNLKKDGLIIIQSYAGGPNIIRNPSYIHICKSQLSKYGLNLVDLFCWKTYPHVALYVATRGSTSDLPKSFQTRKPLSTFHGRGNEMHGFQEICQAYDYLSGLKIKTSPLRAGLMNIKSKLVTRAFALRHSVKKKLSLNTH